MDKTSFTPLEETISFYTRNDFAIMNHLLVGNFDDIWKYAMLAYGDNRGIIEEYETGVRSIDSDYDIKWLNALKKRLLDALDDAAKETIIDNAKRDIANILNAMYPAKEEILLPPMKCKVVGMRGAQNAKCKGIISLAYLSPVCKD